MDKFEAASLNSCYIIQAHILLNYAYIILYACCPTLFKHSIADRMHSRHIVIIRELSVDKYNTLSSLHCKSEIMSLSL